VSLQALRPSLRLLASCNSWLDVQKAAEALGTGKAQGDLFEVLVLLYLKLDPTYQALLDDVWLLKDVPPGIRRFLDLGDGDIGIDIVCKTREGKYWAVQAKYRSDPHQPLSWKTDLSTFAGLVAGRSFEQALVATTTIDISERSKQGLRGNFGFLKADVWTKLDREFFSRLSAKVAGKRSALKPRPPRRHQLPAVRDVVRAFGNASRAKLLMACGTGKTLTSFFIAERMRAARVLIAVPNLGLARQILREWMRESVARGRRPRGMVICSDQKVASDEDLDIEVTDLGVHVTTDVAEATAFLRSHREYIVITTYQSGLTTAAAASAAKIVFDLAIFDEAHKTVGQKGNSWTHLIFNENIRISKRLFMTATERVFLSTPEDVELVDMGDVEHYGRTAHSLTFLQALRDRLLCDYRVVTLETTTTKAEQLLSARRLVLPKGFDQATRVEMVAAALELLDGMHAYAVRHVITYHSSIRRARFFETLLFALSRLPKYKTIDISTFHLNGSHSAARRDDVMKVALAAKYSIVTNCRCLTEGIDVPAMDGVAFIDAKGSKVDIVQAVGRALRRSAGKRLGYVFLPAVLRKTQTLEDLNSGPYAATAATITAMGTMDADIVAMVGAIAEGRAWAGTRAMPFTMPVGIKIDPAEFGRGLALRIHDRLTKRRWTEKNLIEAIVARKKKREALNSGTVQREDPGLVRAGRMLFGSWDNALKAAGIDPRIVRHRRPAWTKEEVLVAVRARNAKGLPINAGKMQRDEVALHRAGVIYFGSWDNTLRAAGIDPIRVRLVSHDWTKAAVIAAIKERNRKSKKLNAGAVAKDHGSLAVVAVRLFGSWDEALKASGIDPESVRRRVTEYSKAAVIRVIRDRKRRSLKLNHGSAPTGLINAAKRNFGTWDRALRAAGIDPKAIRLKRKWSKSVVVEALHERQKNGARLDLAACQKDCPALVAAAYNYCGNWGTALRAAGIDPNGLKASATWKQEILAFIHARKKKALKLNSWAVEKIAPKVINRARRIFGSWDQALQAAGLDPDEVRPRRRWTRQSALEAIRDRKRKGLALNVAAMLNEDLNLKNASSWLFGSWNHALRAAGIDPNSVRVRRRDWTRQAVVTAIRERRRRRLPVNAAAVQKEAGGLADAVYNFFLTWSAALSAAGIDPQAARPPSWALKWTKSAIIKAIRERKRKQQRLNHGAAPSGLAGAAIRVFGGWDGALSAAGIDPAKVRLARRWTKGMVIEAIRRRRSKGAGLNFSSTPPDLTGGARKLFGSWDKALRAAGLRPEHIRLTTQGTKLAVAQALRERQKKRLRVDLGASRKDRPGLVNQAYRLFGNWDNALRAAGINPDEVRVPGKRVVWTESVVVAALRDRRKKGKGLNSTAVLEENDSLYHAARRRFGSWDKALQAAGINPEAVRLRRSLPKAVSRDRKPARAA
jgi:superfamily II DNA or RNA helicase